MKNLINFSQVMTRYYLVVIGEIKKNRLMFGHEKVVIDRPTPWSLFLNGFLHPSRLGFAVLDDDELARILSNKYALTFKAGKLQSNGDSIHVQKWGLLNVCKFCLEGFQYKTFLRFWAWRW